MTHAERIAAHLRGRLGDAWTVTVKGAEIVVDHGAAKREKHDGYADGRDFSWCAGHRDGKHSGPGACARVADDLADALLRARR